jgi:outer membrane cobalamin receptor
MASIRVIRRIRHIFLFFLTLLPVSLFAENDLGTISGTVSDSTGALVPGAVIEATNENTVAHFKTSSNERGQFALKLPPGEYRLRISARGFKELSRTGLKISTAQSLNVDAQLEVAQISQIVTVDTESPLTKMKNPQLESASLQTATSQIDKLEIEKQGAKTVVDALNYVPGAWTETRGRKEKQLFSVRGQRYPYPEYAIDGALFREFIEVPYFLSAEDVERIEVLRSSAALLTGISGLAGVVNIIPREYEKRETRWLAEYGSMNSYRVHIAHGQKVGDFSYGLGLGDSHTDGPEGRHGAEKMLNLFANTTWNPGKFSIRGTALFSEGKRDLVQAEPPAAAQYRTALQRYDPVQDVAGSLKILYRPVDWASTQIIIGYSNHHNKFIDDTNGIPQESHDYDHEWNLNLIQAFAASKQNVLRIGTNYNHWIAPYGKRFYSGRRTDLETCSVAVTDEQSIGRLLLDGGLRYQRTYINEYGAFNIEGTANAFKNVPSIRNVWQPGEPSGSAGATYYLTPKLSLRANFLSGVIEPRNGILTAKMSEPVNEHRQMWDLGFRLIRDTIGEFTLTGFYLRQKNAIVLSGSTAKVNGQLVELYLNRDQNSKGLEFEFKSRPLIGNISAFFNMTAMDPQARFNISMSRDTETPQAIMSAGVLGKMRGFDYNIFWKYMSSYANSRFADPAVPQPLGDFHAVNLTVGRMLDHNEKIRICFEAVNIGNSRYSTVVGYPDYGRRLDIGIRQLF